MSQHRALDAKLCQLLTHFRVTLYNAARPRQHGPSVRRLGFAQPAEPSMLLRFVELGAVELRIHPCV